jgi:hypothetical protein
MQSVVIRLPLITMHSLLFMIAVFSLAHLHITGPGALRPRFGPIFFAGVGLGPSIPHSQIRMSLGGRVAMQPDKGFSISFLQVPYKADGV